MKAEELMIGDWVDVYHELPDESGFYKPLQVTGMHNHDGVCFGHNAIECPWIDPEEFEAVKPIPLTPEILKKNGYSYNETRDVWELIPNDGFGICKDEEDNCFYFSLGVFDAFNRHSDITYHYITKIDYVHELQHALKLCGIEKEIIL